MTVQKHTISVLVENKFGVLARIAGMFSGRGFNINTLNVAPTHEAALSRLTVTVKGDSSQLDQCIKQLGKLINVIEIKDFQHGEYVARELVMLKVRTTSQTRSEIMQICQIFRGKIINVGRDSVIVEMTGNENKVKAFLELISPFGISELARTGNLALERFDPAPATEESEETGT